MRAGLGTESLKSSTHYVYDRLTEVVDIKVMKSLSGYKDISNPNSGNIIDFHN